MTTPSLKAGELQSLQDKLRTITDLTWCRRGTLLCAGPMNDRQAKSAEDAMASFGMTPDNVVAAAGAALSIPITQVQTGLGHVSRQDLREWGKE